MAKKKAVQQDFDPKEYAITALRDLIESPGWRLIVQALDENIKDADEQTKDPELKKLPPIEYMARMTELINKKLDRENLKDLPRTLAEEFTGADELPPEFDPYDK